MICVPMKKTKKTIGLLKAELNSRIEIQQRSLQTYSKEIFDNIGQVLSLVKLQLKSLEEGMETGTPAVSESGKLIGKVISDLRSLTRQLSPDEIIRKGFAYGIGHELNRLTEAGFCESAFSIQGDPCDLEDVKELVIFCILQQLIYPVLNICRPGCIQIGIEYKMKRIIIEVTREYEGEPLLLDTNEMEKLGQRLSTIDAFIFYKETNRDTLQLTINI